MKKWWQIVLVSVCMGTMQSAAAEDLTALKQEGRMLAKQFMMTLKPELMQAIKSGGAVHALEVCQIKAPAIAEAVQQQSGWQVKRVSLKNRNPGNAPDAFEHQVLLSFERQKAAGVPIKQLEYGEKVSADGQTVFRYMKAIPTQKVCLRCHGQQLAQPVQDKLRALYPEDKAIGFQAGDIRGAFSFRKVLQ